MRSLHGEFEYFGSILGVSDFWKLPYGITSLPGRPNSPKEEAALPQSSAQRRQSSRSPKLRAFGFLETQGLLGCIQRALTTAHVSLMEQPAPLQSRCYVSRYGLLLLNVHKPMIFSITVRIVQIPLQKVRAHTTGQQDFFGGYMKPQRTPNSALIWPYIPLRARSRSPFKGPQKGNLGAHRTSIGTTSSRSKGADVQLFSASFLGIEARSSLV